MDVSRRRFLLGATGLLVACQSQQPQPAAPTAPAAAPTGAPKPVIQPAASPSPAAAASPSAAASPAAVAPSAVPKPSPGVSASPSPSPSPAAAAAAAQTVAGKPMYQMDPQHTGRSPYNGPRSLKLLRSFDTWAPELRPPDPLIPIPDIQSGIVVGPDGTIYATTFAGYLYALRNDPSSTDRLALAWRFRPAGGSPFHGTAAISRDGNTVYVPFTAGTGAEAKGTLFAVRAPASGQDGQIVWQTDLQGNVQDSVTVGPDGSVYICNVAGLLSVIDPGDGHVKWTAQTGTSGAAQFGQTVKMAPALASDGTVYTTAVTGSLYAVSPSSGSGNQGSVKWSFDFGQHLGPTPLVSTPVTNGGNRGQDAIGSAASATIGPDGTIYVGANNSNFYAIDPNGQQKWLFEAERELAGIWTTACLSADNSTLFFGANKGGMYALNARDGSLKWQFPVYGSIYSSAALDARGTLYTGSSIEHVYALDSSSGALVADFAAQAAVWTAPAIRPDGTLAVGDRQGRILVLGDGS